MGACQRETVRCKLCRFSQAEVHPCMSDVLGNVKCSSQTMKKKGPGLCSNLDKIGGCRVEVRVGGKLANGMQAGKEAIPSFLMFLGKDIHVKKLESVRLQALCQARIGCTHGSTCGQGDARHRFIDAQRELFPNIGFVSAFFTWALSGHGTTKQFKTHPLLQQKLGGKVKKATIVQES